jgi:hypothetical protein
MSRKNIKAQKGHPVNEQDGHNFVILERLKYRYQQEAVSSSQK